MLIFDHQWFSLNFFSLRQLSWCFSAATQMPALQPFFFILFPSVVLNSARSKLTGTIFSSSLADPTELLRSSTNSFAVCLLGRFLADSTATKWLRETISPIVKPLTHACKRGTGGTKFVYAVLDEIERFSQSLIFSVSTAPLFLRVMFLQLKRCMSQRHPDMMSVVPSSFMLHVLCPALISPPPALNITFGPEVTPALMFACKVLQAVSNGGMVESSKTSVIQKVTNITLPVAGLRATDSDATKLATKLTKIVGAISTSLQRFFDSFTDIEAIRSVSVALQTKGTPASRADEVAALHALAKFACEKRVARLLKSPLPSTIRASGVRFADETAKKSRNAPPISSLSFVDDQDVGTTSDDDALIDFETASAVSFKSAGASPKAKKSVKSVVPLPLSKSGKTRSIATLSRKKSSDRNLNDDSGEESGGSRHSSKSAKSDSVFKRNKPRKAASTAMLPMSSSSLQTPSSPSSPKVGGGSSSKPPPLPIVDVIRAEKISSKGKKRSMLEESELASSILANRDIMESRDAPTDIDITMSNWETPRSHTSTGSKRSRKSGTSGKKSRKKKKATSIIADEAGGGDVPPAPPVSPVPVSPTQERRTQREIELEAEAERFLAAEALEESRKKLEQKAAKLDRAKQRVESLRQAIESEYAKHTSDESSHKQPRKSLRKSRSRSKSKPSSPPPEESVNRIMSGEGEELESKQSVETLLSQVVERMTGGREATDDTYDILSDSADSDASPRLRLDELELDDMLVADDVTGEIPSDSSNDGGLEESLSVSIPSHLLDRTVKDIQGKRHRVSDILAKSDTVIFVLLRQFGCMLCRRFLTELWQTKAVLDQVGARVVALGFGSARFAHFFKEDTLYSGEIYLDDLMHVYNDLHCRRGWRRALFNKSTLARIGQGLALGYRQGKTNSDFLQLGGVFVFRGGSRMIFQHTEKYAGDHPELKDLLTAVGAGHLLDEIKIQPIKDLKKAQLPSVESSSSQSLKEAL